MKIAKINTNQMQAPPKTLNLVLAINKHLKVSYAGDVICPSCTLRIPYYVDDCTTEYNTKMR